MGAGGIIQQQAQVLVDTLGEPCFYNAMHSWFKSKLGEIRAKAFLDRDAQDLQILSAILHATVSC